MIRENQFKGFLLCELNGMLVHQGASGFTIWTGIEAPVEVMYQVLKEVFG